MKTLSFVKLGVLFAMACILAGCKCSSGNAEGKEGELDMTPHVGYTAKSKKSTKDHSEFVDVDWSKYVYEVRLNDRSYDYLTMVTIDMEESGRVFEEHIGRYDVIAVPYKGEKILIRVSDSTRSYSSETKWLVSGNRKGTPPGDKDFDWGPFLKYAE